MFIRKPEEVIYITDLVEQLLDSNNKDVSIDFKVANYIGPYPNLFPMTNFFGSINRATKLNLENQQTISIRWLKSLEAKRRYEGTFNVIHWYIALVFFNTKPIALLRSPDTRNDGYSKLYILDKLNHQKATAFIFQHMESDPGPELEMWGLDAPSGSFGGDVQPHIRSMNYDSSLCLDYKNIKAKTKLNYIINYTIDPHFNWEEVNS